MGKSMTMYGGRVGARKRGSEGGRERGKEGRRKDRAKRHEEDGIGIN